MTVRPTLSITEAQALTALRSFILGLLPSGVEVIRTEQNRVPEPRAADYVLMTPIRQTRLSTNDTDFYDNVIVGEIAATTLTVTDVTQSEGAGLQPGMALIDAVYPVMNILPDTYIVAQLTGTPGGVGTYTISPTQTLASETLYAGQAAALVPTQFVVQLDVHGPQSANYTKLIEGLFRSEFGSDSFTSSGFDVQPLYCGEARQMPFVNAEQAFEYRWTMDACMQINPVIGTPQQFAETLEAEVFEVDGVYPP